MLRKSAPVHFSLAHTARNFIRRARVFQKHMASASGADLLNSGEIIDVYRVAAPLVAHFHHPQSDVPRPEPGIAPPPRKQLSNRIFPITQNPDRLTHRVDPFRSDILIAVDDPAYGSNRHSGSSGDILDTAGHELFSLR